VSRPALAVAAALFLLVGCSVSTDKEPTREPPSELSLRQADLPEGLTRCNISGSIDGYLKNLRTANPSAWRDLDTSWRNAQAEGADAADVALFTDQTSACTSGLIASTGRSAASLAIRYPHERAATTAWHGGILDLPVPASDQQGPGLTQGIGTGLGANSWSYVRTSNGRATYLAFWQNGSFDILVATGGITPEQARLASTAVSSRVR
jgi:hypothetical protein